MLFKPSVTRRLKTAPKHGTTSGQAEAALGKICGEDDAKTGKMSVVWILFRVTQIVRKWWLSMLTYYKAKQMVPRASLAAGCLSHMSML
jgi:hypothetical protein